VDDHLIKGQDYINTAERMLNLLSQAIQDLETYDGALHDFHERHPDLGSDHSATVTEVVPKLKEVLHQTMDYYTEAKAKVAEHIANAEQLDQQQAQGADPDVF
jgi:gas vesicle protein